MKDRRFFSWDRSAGVLPSVMALILAGCGGDTSTTAGKSEGTAAKDSSPPAAVSQKSIPKKGLKGMAPGGDLGVRERRAQTLKDRAAAKE
jgi:hypothetical protein